MPDNYATAVLYKADIERELYNRATGVDIYITLKHLTIQSEPN